MWIELEIAGKLPPENEKIQTDIDYLRNHINREKNDESDQEYDVKDRTEQHMQSVNECMELMMKENIAGTEGIAEETQMDGPREEGYSEEKKVKGTDTNWEELD